MENTRDIVDILMVGINRETEAICFTTSFRNTPKDTTSDSNVQTIRRGRTRTQTNLELEVLKPGRTVSEPVKPGNTPLDFMVDLSKVSSMDCGDLLVIAMNKEKEAFRFYLELYAMTTNRNSAKC
jgi:hypothetical protein